MSETRCFPPVVRQDDAIQILFTGDAHFGPAYANSRVFDRDIQSICRQNDYVVVNIESPITASPPQVPHVLNNPVLHSDLKSFAALETLGNVVFNLANNHAFDHGVVGLRDTIQAAKDRGWLYLGAGENLEEASSPCIIRGGNVTVGLLAVSGIWVPFADESSHGAFGETPESRVRTKIRELKQQARWVVVVYHGGEEYVHAPMPPRRKRLMRYLGYGADVVVAHHAHCVQRYEQFGDKYIFYGLGNLVFDRERQRQFEGTDESVLLSLSFSERSIRFHPFFTRQDREQCLVVKAEPNPHFAPISPQSYALEWGIEASRRFDMIWRLQLGNLPSHSWKRPFVYFWKRLRRIGYLMKLLRNENYRPFITGAVLHHLRSFFRPRRRN